MRKYVILFLLLLPFQAIAQNLVTFKLTPHSTFATESGEDFIVVPFEGKTAHQIYQTLASNVSSLYNNPSKVMTGVEDASIKIRALSENMYTNKFMGTSGHVAAYYQLEFRIKDGRVRVSAPYIEDTATFHMYGSDNEGAFRRVSKKWFKDGEVKAKHKAQITEVENNVNSLINCILGFTGSSSSIDDDW